MLNRQGVIWQLSLMLVLVVTSAAYSMDFYVSPNGSADAGGGRDDPWDLKTALSGTQSVAAGDTIWLSGGVYRGGLASELMGTKQQPITVRGMANQKVVLDLSPTEAGQDAHFYVRGEHTIYRNFEVTCSDLKRITKTPGPYAEDINRGGISCHGSSISFQNLIVHDLESGFECWSEDIEIYGCVIYNNGWAGPRRGYGDGILCRAGNQRFANNIIFNQFGRGVNCFAAGDTSLSDLQISGNVRFGSGRLRSHDHRDSAVYIGASATNVVILGNYFYQSGLLCGSLAEPRIQSLAIRNNYLVGSLAINDARRFAVMGNTVVGEDTVVRFGESEKLDHSTFVWDENNYFLPPSKYAPFNVAVGDERTSFNHTDWRSATADRGSRFQQTWPTENAVFVQPNRVDAGRAHIIAYNWLKDATIKVDLSDALNEGVAFKVFSAQALSGEPVTEGVYRGGLIEIPMKPTKATKPVGMDDYELPITEPVFGVFIVQVTANTE